jgi:hypothetical protein
MPTLTTDRIQPLAITCKMTLWSADADAAKTTPMAETISVNTVTRHTSATQLFTPTQSKNTPLAQMVNFELPQLLDVAEEGPEKMYCLSPNNLF